MNKNIVTLIFLCVSLWGINSSFLFFTSSPKLIIDSNKNELDTLRTYIDGYIWPTDASKKMTSSFAEYRTKHFHGGIDISTNGETGYKVFAVEDGYVYRIWIAPKGYGKMLFIKHRDGIISTYAHLQTFNEKINEAVREEQYRVGTYAINLLLDSGKIPIKKGELIAYTGDTGFGPPHLHFELRDENLNPINPLISSKFKIIDDIPPIIRRVLIKPLSYGTTINNKSQPMYLSRFPRHQDTYLIPQTLRVHGQIGFCIDADDRTNETWARTGIHRIEFYLDDSLTFAMTMDRIPVDDTKLVDLQYDLPSILDGRGHFQKLFIEKGNSLPFFNNFTQGAGIINTESLTEGEHNYKIYVYDTGDNKSELRGTLIANHEPKIKLIDIDNQQVKISGERLEDIEKVILYGKRAYQPNWSQHTLTKNRFTIDNNEISLPINTKPYDVLKIVGYSKFGSETQPIYKFIKKPIGPERDIHIDTEILHDYILFTITTPAVFTEPPEISIESIKGKTSISTSPIELNEYQAIYTPTDDFVGSRTVKVEAEVNGKQVSTSTNLSVFVIQPDKANYFTYDDGRIKISYDSGAVFRPMYMQIEKGNYNRYPIYELKPRDLLLNRGLKISIKSNEPNNYLGLYYRSNQGWIFQTAAKDEGTEYFSTLLTYTLGDIGLFQDDIAPTIGRLHLKYNNPNLYISFRYYDNLSGVDTDEIKIYLDNKLIIPEIDGEHSKVFLNEQEHLDKGKHIVRITLKDRMKNSTELVRTLNVK